MDEFSNKSCMTISTDRTLNINMSDIVIQNLIDISKVWSSIQEDKNQVQDDLFNQIDQYQSREVSKYSVDDVLYHSRANRFADLENSQQNVANVNNDLVAPVSIINLTGISISIHKINDEEEKDTLAFGNSKHSKKVYVPIRVEFENDHLPIEHVELSKLHSGRHQLTENNDDLIYYGVHLNKMQKILTVRTCYTIHNQTIFTYILRIYNENLDEYIINPDQKFPILRSIQGKK